MRRSSKPVSILFFMLIISCLFLQCNKNGGDAVNEETTGKAVTSDSLAFGDTTWISEGMIGKVYFLPDTTTTIPSFDTMHAEATLYTHMLNIPERSWATGFPGVPDRFEWFGLEYKGNFSVLKPGHYQFRIVSDDGSRLFIDDKLIIDNDGLHGAASKTGDIDLDGSDHTITVQYFQGPRFAIALQVFATLEKETEQVFPGDNFKLVTPGTKKSHTMLYIIGGSLLLLAFIFLSRKKRKKEEVTA